MRKCWNIQCFGSLDHVDAVKEHVKELAEEIEIEKINSTEAADELSLWEERVKSCKETQSVLKFATNRSLAILDELGRGTSTFDGYAIAKAMMDYMVRKVNCMTLFSTQYHMLLHDFRDYPGVQNYHMAHKANTGQSDRVTFLFKFIKGECPESFGMNVARTAKLPPTVP